MAKATYQSAGVDLEKYREAMERLPLLMHRTFSPRVIKQDGGFAGLFQLDFNSQLFARRYDQPVLVACTDGVGTKLKVAQRSNCHDTVGIDLVAMCVNDAICTGGEPLFFLDYVAMSHDDPPLLEAIVRGISNGCLQADCALLGGETAIMPDLYSSGDYDLAGFCVAVVEKSRMINGDAIAPDDLVLGIAANGLHSNGYSLARKVVFEIGKFAMDDEIPELGQTVQQALLQPTRIYVKVLRDVIAHYTVKSVVHGIAHITGGGLLENIQRIVPETADVVINKNSWHRPAVFDWLQRLGDIDGDEMDRVFNMGLGMVLVVSPFYAGAIQTMVTQAGLECWQIGQVQTGRGQVRWA